MGISYFISLIILTGNFILVILLFDLAYYFETEKIFDKLMLNYFL